MDSSINGTGAVVLQLQGPSRAPAILAGNLIPEVIATAFFLARVYARAWLLRNWGADDTLLALSWLGSFILCACSCLSTKYGSGHHIWDIPEIPHQYIIPTLQIGFGSLLVYQVTLALTKLSICLFYLRLFNDRTTKHLVYITMAFITLYTIPTVIFSIFQCKPVAGYWNVTESSTCVNPSPAFYVNGIGNILADAWLIIMAIPRIWHLKLAQKHKVALFVIITLSWLVIIAAIVRMVRLGHLFRTKVTDTTWVFYDISIWTGLEVSMGIFCVSAPAIKPIFKGFAPHLLSSYGSTDSKNKYVTSTRPGDTSSRNRLSRNMWGDIELPDQDAPRSESIVKGSLTRSHSSSSFWRSRVVESDARSTEDVLPFMGSKMEVHKHTVVTVEIRDRKQSAGSGVSSIESREDLNNRSIMKLP